MKMIARQIGTFIVRVWLEPTLEGAGVWRASATDTVSKERHHFAKPEELMRFLAFEGSFETWCEEGGHSS